MCFHLSLSLLMSLSLYIYIHIYTPQPRGWTQNCLGYPGCDLLWVSTAVAGSRCLMYDACWKQSALASGYKSL